MKREEIEPIFHSLLSVDDCTDFTDTGIYLLRPLTKTVSGESIEYGFSLTIFGVMALRTQYKGKWANAIEITHHCQKNLNFIAEPISTNEFYHVVIDTPETLKQVCEKIYSYCRNNIRADFACCHLYEECSDKLMCINPMKQRGLLCGYRKKLENGIVYYGKNRTVQIADALKKEQE